LTDVPLGIHRLPDKHTTLSGPFAVAPPPRSHGAPAVAGLYQNGGWQWMLNPQGQIIGRADTADMWQILQPQQIPHVVRRHFGKP